MGTKMQSSIKSIVSSKEEQVMGIKSVLEFSDEVKAIDEEIAKDITNQELYIKKGIELSKQLLFREAVECYSTALAYNPFNGLLYRHRGHRYLSTYRFFDAAADLEIATRLDPLNWDSWYHLGLSYYLLGDFERANNAYTRCLELTDLDSLELVAILDWKSMTLRRLGREEEAFKLFDLVNTQTEAGENVVYKERVLMYKGEMKPEEVLDYKDSELADLELATQGYGVAMHYYFTGEKEKSKEVMELLLNSSDAWAAFGYLAAFQDVKRIF